MVTIRRRDGDKNLNMRVLASWAKSYLPQIRSDLDLLEKLLATYTAGSKIVMEKKGQK